MIIDEIIYFSTILFGFYNWILVSVDAYKLEKAPLHYNGENMPNIYYLLHMEFQMLNQPMRRRETLACGRFVGFYVRIPCVCYYKGQSRIFEENDEHILKIGFNYWEMNFFYRFIIHDFYTLKDIIIFHEQLSTLKHKVQFFVGAKLFFRICPSVRRLSLSGLIICFATKI